MEQIHSVFGMQSYSLAAKRAGKKLGLVPTMGKFHEGHLSLMRKAREDCDATVVSLFVNPAQFSPGEDYANYPRDHEGDRVLAEKEGVDVLFCPPAEEIYPPDFQAKVSLPGLENKLCGLHRPIHFSGVATVVLKLFNIVRPDRAYFGEKDYQQLLVIKRLVKDLNVDTEVIGLPTVREPDGLAMSSRNEYLRGDERDSARSLFQALQSARNLVASGERNAARIKEKMRETIGEKPGTEIQYISICHPETLEDMEEVKETALAALAVRVGKARLIDNCILSAQVQSD